MSAKPTITHTSKHECIRTTRFTTARENTFTRTTQTVRPSVTRTAQLTTKRTRIRTFTQQSRTETGTASADDPTATTTSTHASTAITKEQRKVPAADKQITIRRIAKSFRAKPMRRDEMTRMVVMVNEIGVSEGRAKAHSSHLSYWNNFARELGINVDTSGSGGC